MTEQIISRAEAMTLGLRHYFTGKPCLRGHLDVRDVAWKKCVACQREKSVEKYRRDPEAARRQKYAWRDSHKDIVLAKGREFYARNRERILADKREYFKRNKEERKAYYKRRYSEHRVALCLKQTDYRRQNPELVAASFKRWREANPEIVALHSRVRRARQRNARGTHTVEEVAEIRRRQKNKCAYCAKSLGKCGHLDHIKPLSKGGTNYANNLQWLCESCNLRKHAKEPLYFARSMGFLL